MIMVIRMVALTVIMMIKVSRDSVCDEDGDSC